MLLLFALRLASKLGKTLKELIESMSYREFMLWLCYYEIEPWGESLDGLRMASINSAIYNAGLMMANPKRLRTKPFSPDQFYIGVNSRPKRANHRTWKEQRKMYEKVLGKAKK